MSIICVHNKYDYFSVADSLLNHDIHLRPSVLPHQQSIKINIIVIIISNNYHNKNMSTGFVAVYIERIGCASLQFIEALFSLEWVGLSIKILSSPRRLESTFSEAINCK